MHRFFLPPTQTPNPSPALTGREAHHAAQVLRLQRGEMLTLLDGAGGTRLCEVQNCTRDSVQLIVKEEKKLPPPPCRITLLQALPKGKIFEDIIQKATELGVHRIVPILSERVTTRLDEENAAVKTAKWRLVAIEAIKQCGAAWLPEICKPQTPARFLARNETFDLPLIASLHPGSRPAREYFDAFRHRHLRQPASIGVWIGPEGDLSPAEVQSIVSGGALPITLGPLVLRVETAAIYCMSIANHELLVDAQGSTAEAFT